jgi:hypothetical protein
LRWEVGLESFTEHFLARLALEIEMLGWSDQWIRKLWLTIYEARPGCKRNF